ncbi:MAG: hypothetical protein AB1791_20775 [Chloroflexota bacterium]
MRSLRCVFRVTRPLGLLLAFTTLACAVPLIGGPAETPVPPTPMGDTLPFIVPLYSITLDPGDTVPGTHLTYVGQRDDAYDVTIDGLTATKRSGDSFIWRGVIGPGVVAKYNLRIGTAVRGRLLAAGPVELSVLSPTPVELSEIPLADNALHYQNIAVQYVIPQGRAIPGTTLVYEGTAEEGVRLSGINGYPYRALGDSLIWIGQLREGSVIRYSLRVASVDEPGLQLVGTAELWVTPAQ